MKKAKFIQWAIIYTIALIVFFNVVRAFYLVFTS